MASRITLDDISTYISDQPLRGVADILKLIALDLKRRKLLDDANHYMLRLAIFHVNTATDRLREA